jgi:hypothetical protein
MWEEGHREVPPYPDYVVWALLPRLFWKRDDLFPLRPFQKDVSNAI